MIDFYIDKYFEFKGQLFGRLRVHSTEDFIRYVKVTKVAKEYTNWISIDPDEEIKVKKHFETIFNDNKS